MEIKVPQLAENVEMGTIVNVLVQEGDVVKKDQPVVEIETAKAVAPIPSPIAGRVTKIHVKAGDEVPVGRTLVTVTENGMAGTAGAKEASVLKPASKKAGKVVESPIET